MYDICKHAYGRRIKAHFACPACAICLLRAAQAHIQTGFSSIELETVSDSIGLRTPRSGTNSRRNRSATKQAALVAH